MLNIHEARPPVDRHAAVANIGVIRIVRRTDAMRGQHNCYRVTDVEEAEEFLLRGLSSRMFMYRSSKNSFHGLNCYRVT